MNRELFWKLIEESRKDVDDCDEQAERLTALLSDLQAEEIADFERHFDECRFAAYRQDLWAVAYIVNGGCSDDGFEYFRCWLISQGREYFETALKEPTRAADNASVEDDSENECEALMYCAMTAYEKKTGKEIPEHPIPYPDLAGEDWAEDDLEELYPDLCKKFGYE